MTLLVELWFMFQLVKYSIAGVTAEFVTHESAAANNAKRKEK